MPTEPPPNPFTVHPNEDPDHLAARAAKSSFAEQAAPIRSNPDASARFKAQQVSDLYDAHVRETAEAYERITARRQARLDYLTGLVPSGPGIPDDASPADRAVLVQAFRTALEVAKSASRAERGRLLDEATRYGDDARQRALLQYASESGDTALVNDWVARTHGVADYSDEVRQLRSGGGAWDRDFAPLPKPQEAHDWPLIKDDPDAQPGDNGRMVRPGVIEYDRR